jgi:hypothetical protein
MRRILAFAAVALVMAAGPALAQEYRFSANVARGYSDRPIDLPNIQMQRRADNLVVSVRVACDTRDAAGRRREITETLRAMARAAGSNAAIEISLDAAGNVIAFDESMVPNLSFFPDDGRPDTSAVTLVVKTPISATDTVEAASGRIRDFVARAPRTGRSELRIMDDWEPTVISPDQYRAAILSAISQDALTTAQAFGDEYRVEVTGLARQVTWRRAGPLDLMLYIPYQLSVTPGH